MCVWGGGYGGAALGFGFGIAYFLFSERARNQPAYSKELHAVRVCSLEGRLEGKGDSKF